MNGKFHESPAGICWRVVPSIDMKALTSQANEYGYSICP
jgi:hypothetical protein